MGKQSVQIQYNVHCKWAGESPVYRLFVDGELFTELTYIWHDQYLEEVIPINAQPGDYVITYELLGAGTLTVENPQVLSGPGEFIGQNVIRIKNESL